MKTYKRTEVGTSLFFREGNKNSTDNSSAQTSPNHPMQRKAETCGGAEEKKVTNRPIALCPSGDRKGNSATSQRNNAPIPNPSEIRGEGHAETISKAREREREKFNISKKKSCLEKN